MVPSDERMAILFIFKLPSVLAQIIHHDYFHPSELPPLFSIFSLLNYLARIFFPEKKPFSMTKLRTLRTVLPCAIIYIYIYTDLECARLIQSDLDASPRQADPGGV